MSTYLKHPLGDFLDLLEEFRTPASAVDHFDLCKTLGFFYTSGIDLKAKWAVKMWDSSSKIQPELLTGNLNSLGNYDQCISVRDVNTHLGPFSGQYCLATFKPVNDSADCWLGSLLKEYLDEEQETDFGFGVLSSKGLRWGFCVPSACSAQSVTAALSEHLGPNSGIEVIMNDTDCVYYKEQPFSDFEWFTIFAIAVLLLVVALSTGFELWKVYVQNRWFKQRMNFLPIGTSTETVHGSTEMMLPNLPDVTGAPPPVRRHVGPNTEYQISFSSSKSDDTSDHQSPRISEENIVGGAGPSSMQAAAEATLQRMPMMESSLTTVPSQHEASFQAMRPIQPVCHTSDPLMHLRTDVKTSKIPQGSKESSKEANPQSQQESKDEGSGASSPTKALIVPPIEIRVISPGGTMVVEHISEAMSAMSLDHVSSSSQSPVVAYEDDQAATGHSSSTRATKSSEAAPSGELLGTNVDLIDKGNIEPLNQPESSEQQESEDGANTGSQSSAAQVRTDTSPEIQPESPPYDDYSDIWHSFSFYSNWKELFSKPQEDYLKSLDGIKVLSLIWVMLGHAFLISESLPGVNYFRIKKIDKHWPAMILLNAQLAADTFMVCSGTLMAYIFLKDMKLRGIYLRENTCYATTELKTPEMVKYLPVYYFYRYIRFAPALAFLMLLQTSLMHRFGSGPFWRSGIEYMTQVCANSWWGTLTFIQNWISPDQICLPHAWYMMADLQLYFYSPMFLLFLLTLCRQHALSMVAAFCAMGFFITFAVNLVMRLPPGFLQAESHFWAEKVNFDYAMTFTRMAPFSIGLIVGYFLFHYKCKNDEATLILKRYKVAIWSIVPLFLLYPIFGLAQFQGYGETYRQEWAAIYNCSSHLLWSLALGWIIFACETNQGCIVRPILTRELFRPLARMSYSIYLVHVPLMITRALTTRAPAYTGETFIMSSFVNDVLHSILFAIPLYFVVERPFIRLYKRTVHALGNPVRHEESAKKVYMPKFMMILLRPVGTALGFVIQPVIKLYSWVVLLLSNLLDTLLQERIEEAIPIN